MNWLSFLIVSVQVSLVAALGLVAASLLRSAAHRHSVLLAALLCILASPLFYAGAAWTGLTVHLPAIFPAPHESAKAARVPTALTPVRQGTALPALSESPLESPQTALQDPPAAARQTPIGAAAAIPEQSQNMSRSPLRADLVIVGIWLAGTLFSLGGVLRSQLKTEFILKAAQPVDQAIDASVIAEAERRLKAVGNLRVATTGKVAGPAVVGLFQPWILIPARYLETLSREELLQVLIHEGAHALRRDPLVALLQRISSALFWWHPMVHFVNRDLTRAREEVCDNFVLTHTEPETYGATLLRLATLSPAMARLPLAIGMFDGRGKLEDRIRGLLDTRRKMLTHVRFITAATVLGAFALLSVFVAATRVGAENPADTPIDDPVAAAKESETEIAKPAESSDAKQLRLFLTYPGESDKPFYDLILIVPPVAQRVKPSTLFHQISEEQGRKILRQLRGSQFFEHAKVTRGEIAPEAKPQYLLRVQLGETSFEESLGWDSGTIARLGALRKALDGDAAKSMDQLLARLEGQRKVWESGEVVDDLKTTLTRIRGTTNSLGIGEPIPIKLELTNVGKVDREHKSHHFILSGSEIIVHDEQGRRVPYLAGGAGLLESQVTIKAGETRVIEECDLSSYYYLRRPGQYSVAFRSDGLPSSNTLHFQVSGEEDLARDGDPMGKLLPRVVGKWTPHGSPNQSPRLRPGRNRVEMPGWQFVFPLTDRGVKGSKAVVWLWLTNDPADESTAPTETFLLASESLGKIARWHAYVHAPPEALEIWPTVKRDLTDALEGRARPQRIESGAARDEPKHAAARPAALKAPQWGETKEGFRARFAATKQLFDAGESIPLKLEIENVSGADTEYSVGIQRAHEVLRVVDERGRPALPLLNLYQVIVGPDRPEKLAAGKSLELASFDLGECYYLRRPDRYAVSWPGKPAAAEFELEVKPDPARAAADGDPIGRLLPLVKGGWWLGASPGGKLKLQPGSNWGETTGRIVRFVKNPPVHKGEGLIQLWLADEPAGAKPVDIYSSIPQSEYLGKLERWHVYFLATDTALRAWPTAKEEIKSALAGGRTMSFQIDSDRDTFAVADEIAFSVSLRNSGSKDIEVPGVYWSAKVILDGKEHKRLAKFIGPWNGPGIIIPGGLYQGSIGLSEYGIKPSALTPGEHKLAVKIGDERSNEMTFTVRGADDEAAAPRLGQVQSAVAPRFGVDRIDPSMLKNKIWLDLKDRLAKSGIKYRWVEVTRDGTCRLSLEATSTSDLAPLKGIPLTYLDLSHTAVTNLAPLEGIPLRVLNLSGSQVESLEPLQGMKLTSLEISLTGVKDLSPLVDAELSALVATNTSIVDLSPLRKMPLAYLDIRNTAVKDLGPLADLPLATLQLEGCPVTDLSPLRNTPLGTLTLTGSQGLDLSQLKGTRLKKLTLSGREIKDLGPLRGLNVESLSVIGTDVKEISALAGMPLKEVSLQDTPVSDLTPLKGMKLTSLYVSEPGTDVAPLAGMELETIGLPADSDVKNIDVLRKIKTLKWIRAAEVGKPILAADFWRRYDAGEFHK